MSGEDDPAAIAAAIIAEEREQQARNHATPASTALRSYAVSACSHLNTTHYAEAVRRGGLQMLRDAFRETMDGPCSAPGAETLDMCATDKAKEQQCADWFVKRGLCSNPVLQAEFAARNSHLCVAAIAISTDYPEMGTREDPSQ